MSEEGPKTEKEELGPIRSTEDARNRIYTLANDRREMLRGKKDAENAIYNPNTSDEMREVFRAEVLALEEEIRKVEKSMEDIAEEWGVELPEADL